MRAVVEQVLGSVLDLSADNVKRVASSEEG